MLDIIMNKYYIVFILQTTCENGWDSDITINNTIIAASTAVLVEWNPYIPENHGGSIRSSADSVYYEIFYGPLNSEKDDSVSTAASLSLIPNGIYILIDNNNRR